MKRTKRITSDRIVEVKQVLAGIELRIKRLEAIKPVYVRVSWELQQDNETRLDELESLRAWIMEGTV